MVRVARWFLEGQKKLVVAGKLVAVKKATLSLPTRQEEMVPKGQGQMRSRLVMESKEDKEETQMMPITRAKQCRLGGETGADDEVEAENLVLRKADDKVEVERLALGKVGKRNKNKNDEDDSKDETPLAERAVVTKAIARSLGEGEAEAGPKMGPGDNR